MQKYIFITLFAFSFLTTAAQSFETRFQDGLSDSMTYSLITLADFDNDSLLDVLLAAQDDSLRDVLHFYKYSFISGLQHQHTLSTGFKNGAFAITDLDSDNQLDIVLSGLEDTLPKTILYKNNGSFKFERDDLFAIAGSLVHTADMNQDGLLEILISGRNSREGFLHIYKKKSDGWSLLLDTIHIAATSLQTLDFNQDSFMDFFISGKDSNGKPLSSIYLNTAAGEFHSQNLAALDGATSVVDVNYDGKLDILLSGNDSTGVPKALRLINTLHTWVIQTDSLPVLNDAHLFGGDFNSNGTIDMNIRGLTAASDTMNVIRHHNGTYDTLNSHHLHDQHFGDFDRDGDLDLIQLTVHAGSASWWIGENKTSGKNQPPSPPLSPIAAKIFNRIFLFWNPGSDDHTPQNTLTYDVSIHTEANDLMSPSFDLFSGHRLLVNHGNSGTNNFSMVKSSGAGVFNYRIQAVDNAYHAFSGGLCTGAGSQCMSVDYSTIGACINEEITLTSAGGQAFWFSFREGYLGSGSAFSLIFSEADTIISISPGGSDLCASVKAFVLEKEISTKKITMAPRHACTGGELTFSVSSGWEQNLWNSNDRGFLSSDTSMMFVVTQSDTVSVSLSDGTGCIVQQSTPIIVSVPVITIENEAYQILQGESVQLNVQGEGIFFWSPSSGLTDTTIGNPVVSPGATTEYTVVLTDSLECTVAGKVFVVVEETAFIPTLFTPNEDGKNDALRVYGLGTANNFRFEIYNREGNLVYATENASEFSIRGWDGISRGVKQPAGMYFWKVSGENNVGRTLLLNGKNAGSIVLIR
jgi:gliding motility-associated-like protein